MHIKIRFCLILGLVFSCWSSIVMAQKQKDPALDFVRKFHTEYYRAFSDANPALDDGQSVYDDAVLTKLRAQYLRTDLLNQFDRLKANPICTETRPDFIYEETLEVAPLIKGRIYNTCVKTDDEHEDLEGFSCARYTLVKRKGNYFIENIDCYRAWSEAEDEEYENYERYEDEEDGPQANLYGGKSSFEYTKKGLIELISGSYVHDEPNCQLNLEVDPQGNYQFKLNGAVKYSGQMVAKVGENYAGELYLGFGEMNAMYGEDPNNNVYLTNYDYFPGCAENIHLEK